MAVETQIDSNGDIEHSYRLDSTEGRIISSHILSSGFSHRYLCNVELVSQHVMNVDSYPESAYCIVYNISPDTTDGNLLDFYAVKLLQHSHSVVKKYYRKYLDCELSMLNRLCEGFCEYFPALEFGVGYYPNGELEYRDVYFYTKDIQKVYERFGFTEPVLSTQNRDVVWAHFGLTLDPHNKVIKLKRYIHPDVDPRLENWRIINGDDTNTTNHYIGTPYEKYTKE